MYISVKYEDIEFIIPKSMLPSWVQGNFDFSPSYSNSGASSHSAIQQPYTKMYLIKVLKKSVKLFFDQKNTASSGLSIKSSATISLKRVDLLPSATKVSVELLVQILAISSPNQILEWEAVSSEREIKLHENCVTIAHIPQKLLYLNSNEIYLVRNVETRDFLSTQGPDYQIFMHTSTLFYNVPVYAISGDGNIVFMMECSQLEAQSITNPRITIKIRDFPYKSSLVHFKVSASILSELQAITILPQMPIWYSTPKNTFYLPYLFDYVYSKFINMGYSIASKTAMWDDVEKYDRSLSLYDAVYSSFMCEKETTNEFCFLVSNIWGEFKLFCVKYYHFGGYRVSFFCV